MQIINEVKLDFCDVLIRPKRSRTVSRSKVDLNRTYEFLNSGREWTGVPIISANMSTTGTFNMCQALGKHGMMTCLHKFYDKDKIVDFYQPNGHCDNSFYTLGIGDEDFEKLDYVLTHLPKGLIKHFCLDVANGYTNYFVDKVKLLRDKVGDAIIMAGNVCTPEMAQELLISGGADIAKIGLGPGSCCTTRIITGVGYPQLSAIAECADAAHGSGGHICADGGCTTPGDVVKAFAAGADFVMLGGMLAGTDECEGEWVTETKYAGGPADAVIKERKALKFYGMSSKEAQEKFYGGVKEYRAAEGKSVTVPYKGSAEAVVQEICGGLRSACAYAGTDKLKDLCKCTTFIRVNRTHNTIYS